MVQLGLNVLFVASQFIIVALAFGTAYGVQRYFNFSLAFASTAAAYAYWTFKQTNIPQLLAFPLAISIGLGWEVFTRQLVFRRLVTRGADALTCLLASLGLYVAATESVRILFGADTKQLKTVIARPFVVLGGTLTETQVAMLCSACLLACFCAVVAQYTVAGRVWNAVRQDSLLSQCFGVDVERVRTVAGAVAGGVLGCAGILSGMDVGLNPDSGLSLFLIGVAVAITARLRSVIAIVMCSVCLAVVRESLTWFLGIGWRDTVLFGLVAFALAVHSMATSSPSRGAVSQSTL